MALAVGPAANAQVLLVDNAPLSVSLSGFDGSGFVPTPAAGQLDSDTWIALGLSQNASPAFGDTLTTSDFSQGTSTGGESAGGVYAFDVGAAEPAIGGQPSGGDLTPGGFALRVRNDTGAAITELTIAYSWYVRNDQGRATALTLWHGADISTAPTQAATGAHTTPLTADGSPAWVAVPQSVTLTGLSIAPAATYEILWNMDDAGGSGSRDEVAVGGISLTVGLGCTPAAAPLILCPDDILDETDTGLATAVLTYDAPLAADDCGADLVPVITSNAAHASGQAFPLGVTTVTWEATDSEANSASCSFDIEVLDLESPTLTCPSDITIDNDVGTAGAVVTYSGPTATDNAPGVGSPVITSDAVLHASGQTFPIGITTVNWSVTDAASLTASCSYTIKVQDAEDPIVMCPDIILPAEPSTCGATAPVDAVATDNAPGVMILQTNGPIAGSTLPLGVSFQSFTATDAASNQTSCSRTIVVQDLQAPSITCPMPQTIAADAGGTTATFTFADATGNDNCPGLSVFRTVGPASPATLPVGSHTVTWVATDASGETATCDTTLTVTDTQPPTITCPADITVNTTTDRCDAAQPFTTPVGTDNLPGATTVRLEGLTEGALFPLGETTQRYQVTDTSDLTAECTFTVTVVDAQAPVATCPAGLSTPTDAGAATAVATYAMPTTTDNCPMPTIARTQGPASGSAFNVGTTTVTWQATDGASLTAQCSFDVTVTDDEAPALVCPLQVTVATSTTACDAVATFPAPTANDNVDGTLTPAPTNASLPGSGDSFPVGTTTLTYSATDAATNTGSCMFTVVVTDAAPPRFEGIDGSTACPADFTLATDAGSATATLADLTPVATDSCSGQALPAPTVTQTAGPSAGADLPLGETVLTWQATDDAGNTATCSTTITVTDQEAPTVVCPSAVTADSDPETCGAVVTYATPIGQDNVSAPGPTTAPGTNTLGSGASFPVGATTETFVTTDAAGNTAECDFSITVADATAPMITCPDNVTAQTEAGATTAAVTFAPATAEDACGATVAAVGTGPLSGDSFSLGTTTVTFEATDDAGNSTQCTVDVTVFDGQAPTITCPEAIAVDSDADLCSAVVTYVAPVGQDNAAGAVTTLDAGSLGSGGVFSVGEQTETWTVTDATGATASCSFTVTVSDAQAPSLVCPDSVSVDGGETCGVSGPYVAPIATDNCTGATTVLTAGLGADATFNIGTSTETYTATDGAGNTVSCSLDVTVACTEDCATTDDEDGDGDAGCDDFDCVAEAACEDVDTDGDGVSNSDELRCETDPADDTSSPLPGDIEDTDDDKLLNCEDDDDDNDGISDEVEEATSTDPRDDDSDADGLLDGQEDANQDGVLDPGETDPADEDSDDDTYEDGEEVNCATDPLDAEDTPADLDASGTCDGAEVDGDNDGVPDGLEVFCGTDPSDDGDTPSDLDLLDIDMDGDIGCVDSDDDGDNVSDADELTCGTNPNGPLSTPSAADLADEDGDQLLACVDGDDGNDGPVPTRPGSDTASGCASGGESTPWGAALLVMFGLLVWIRRRSAVSAVSDAQAGERLLV